MKTLKRLNKYGGGTILLDPDKVTYLSDYNEHHPEYECICVHLVGGGIVHVVGFDPDAALEEELFH